jgi:hypothetical protein
MSAPTNIVHTVRPLPPLSAPRRSARAAFCTLFGALLLATLSVATMHAQGALSAQGFGYPVGGLSARAQGTAGATGEFDPLSSRNPSAVGDIGFGIVSVQGQPDWRTVKSGDIRERSTLQRVPLVAAGVRVKDVAVLVSATTLLDRSFSTRSKGSVNIDGQPVETDDALDARGAISELRLSAGWSWKSLRLGVAAVGVTGEQSVARSRAFPESSGFGSVLDSSRVGFQGVGAAFGAAWRPLEHLLIGGSWRVGGFLDAVRRDTAISSASVPDRLGVGVLYDGIAGTVLSASVERINWSAMNGLGSASAVAQDVTNWAVGAEVISGSFRAAPIFWRVGYSGRALPFLLRDLSVTERILSGGVGIPVAGEAITVDVAVQRAQRRIPGGAAAEDGTALTVGLTIRP